MAYRPLYTQAYTTSATVFRKFSRMLCLRDDGKNKTAIEKAAFTLGTRYTSDTYTGLANRQECLLDIQISDASLRSCIKNTSRTFLLENKTTAVRRPQSPNKQFYYNMRSLCMYTNVNMCSYPVYSISISILCLERSCTFSQYIKIHVCILSIKIIIAIYTCEGRVEQFSQCCWFIKLNN